MTLLQIYGVFGYSLAMALGFFVCAVGVAYYRAGRNQRDSLLLASSALLFALFACYLALVSIAPPWLDRDVTQPIMRTIIIAASGLGWVFMLGVLRKENRIEKLHRQTKQQEKNLSANFMNE